MGALTWVRSGQFIGARQLRQRLSEVIKSNKPFFVTEHGRPVKAMISYADFLELLEAVEELRDSFLVREVARGRSEYGKGSFRSLASLKKLLEGRG